MFQTLQPNQKLFILYKSGTPRLEEGIVQNVSPVKAVPSTTYGQMPVNMVDVTVLVGGQTLTYTLPATSVVGTLKGNGDIVVSMSRDAMNNEILNFKQYAVGELNKADYYNSVISACDGMHRQINPEVVEKERQTHEINSLKVQMSEMASNMNSLMEMNRKLMEELSGRNKTNKTKDNA